MIYERHDLLADLQPGMVAPPHSMVAGTTEKDYYLGTVHSATYDQRLEVEQRLADGPAPHQQPSNVRQPAAPRAAEAGR